MKNVLLFHIGSPKTGTTSLQSFLFNNAGMLKKYDWSYPDLSRFDVVTGDKYLWRNGQNLRWIESEEKRNEVWQIIAENLKQQNVIISDEGNWDGKFSTVLSEAKRIDCVIKVIVYLRRQDQYIESYYNEAVKAGYMHNSIQEYMNPMPSFVDSGVYEIDDYWSRLEDIGKMVGCENIIVRPFEKQQFEGVRRDIISDFMCTILKGAEPDWSEFCIPDHENTSLYGNYFEIKKLLNVVGNDERKPWKKEYTEPLMQLNGKYGNIYSDRVAERYLTTQERKVILDKQKENNSKIAKKYLNKDSGQLFLDTNLDFPVYKEVATPFEEDLVRISSMLFHRMSTKIEMLPLLTAIKILKKGRQLFVYGAGERGKNLLDYPFVPDIIIDNDIKKRGRAIRSVQIIGVEDVESWSSCLVIVTPYHCTEIEQQLQSFGLKKNEEYILMNDFVDDYL